MPSLEMPQSPRIRSKVKWVQILVYTSGFSIFINYLSKIMIKSNATSLLDNTVMLYKQTASSWHDVCLDQRSFKDTGFNFIVRNLPKRICSNCYNFQVKHSWSIKGIKMVPHRGWGKVRVVPKVPLEMLIFALRLMENTKILTWMRKLKIYLPKRN